MITWEIYDLFNKRRDELIPLMSKPWFMRNIDKYEQDLEIFHQGFAAVKDIFDIRNIEYVKDRETQALGYDYVVDCKLGKTFWDCKLRPYAETDDMTIEYQEDGSGTRPGMIEKDNVKTQFLMYVQAAKERGWVVLYPSLKRAWNENKSRWKMNYRDVVSKNTGNRSCPVPIEELHRVGVWMREFEL